MRQMVSPASLEQILRERFGYPQFKEGQQEVITSVLHGRDTLVIKSTGGGKSLCYQLPSLLLKGITLVVTPLISLMEDQVEEARKMGRKDVAALHSGLSMDERKWIVNHLSSYRLLYISPEGLQNRSLISLLNKRGVSLFVVDEAHCISWWGHDFRLDYLRLAQVRKSLGRPACLALTATATQVVKEDIITYLELDRPAVYQFSIDRKNIAIHVERVISEKEKKERIWQLVSQRRDAGMIYFSSRKKAEEFAQYLLERGVERVAYYHGGMSADERQLIQQQFSAGKLRIICATNAFGMGINKQDIRYVLHYHFPQHLEGYVQEMGRCSRDGGPGLSMVFYQPGDEQIHYHLIEQELPRRNKLEELFAFLAAKEREGKTNTLEELMGVINVDEQVIQFVLFHLEELQMITYHSDDRFAFSHVTEEVVDRLSDHIEKLRQRKLKLFQDMYRWLSMERGCRREYLVSYFGEELLTRPVSCCDLCGLEEAFLRQDIDTHGTIGEELWPKEDWRDRLRKLWPIS